MRVFVYRNLTNGCWSIKALEGPNKGRVIGHATRCIVRDATFTVSAAGRARVLASGRKQVHAGIVGTLDGFDGEARIGTIYQGWHLEDRAYYAFALQRGAPVRYNPRFHETFRTASLLDGQDTGPILQAPMAVLGLKGKVWAFDPCTMSGREAPAYDEGNA